jgi:hypothetical protein
VRWDVFLPGGQASPSLLSVGHDVTAAPVQATDGTAAAAERTRRSRGEAAVDRWSCGGGHADCGWFSLVRAICQRRWLDFGSISRSGWKRGEEGANSDFGIGGGWISRSLSHCDCVPRWTFGNTWISHSFLFAFPNSLNVSHRKPITLT